jgi:uroporphyrinogen decarboxylase
LNFEFPERRLHMPLMSKRERLKAALAGRPVDRVPVGFWRHWPGDDQRENSLVHVTLEYQRSYDLDFIKLPVSSSYTVTDYGVKHEYQGSTMGDRTYLERAIKKPEDWERIKPLDVQKGTYGWHLHALRQIIQQKEADTPIIVTMFNPLSVAFYLAGDETGLVHMRRYPERFEAALTAITETSVRFARAALEEGADGIFLSAKDASYELMNEQEYDRFGRPGDLAVLKAASDGWFNVLHLHGQHPMFIHLADYPVQAMNWHDRTAQPDLTEAARLFHGALMGGVEQYQVLHFGTPEEVEEQVKDALKQMNSRRLIITPGCTYPISVPHANLVAVRQAVETPESR